MVRALFLVLLVFLGLITAAGRAWGAPPDPAATLERAAALVRSGEYERGEAMLRRLLAADPSNRGAREMLAFALESMGDLDGEQRVRSSLAAEFPRDPRVQADLGRVLERAGDDGGALHAYRSARARADGSQIRDLDEAIRRTTGRTALEFGTPVALLSDPTAKASSVQAGAAIPFGSRHHASLLGTRAVADAKSGPRATTSHAAALTIVGRRAAGTYWAAGPRLHAVSPRGGAPRDVGVGGAVTGRARLGPSLEADWRAEAETPWDEAATSILHGGRTTAAEGHLYLHSFSRRLLLQAGARRRGLSILDADRNSSARPTAWQSLWLAGADAVVWAKAGSAVRGEMLDEALIAPSGFSPAVILAYRHYEIATQSTPEFNALIGLVPRGSVDEGSVATTLVTPRGDWGFQFRAGIARDTARPARTWRAGGTLIWSPSPANRITVGYEEANESASGLVGRRHGGWLSVHSDF